MSPEMQQTLEFLRAARDTAQPPADPAEALRLVRERAEQLPALYPLPDDVVVEQVDAGGVPADLLVPPGAARDRCLLYLHGGAYVAYSPRSHRELAARLARAAGCAALVPDYRLAPEHPYPAAVEDAVAAWGWAAAQGPAAVAGDSAGGGLALALVQRLRAAGRPLPRALALLSPWTDLTLTVVAAVDDATLDAARLRACAGQYAAGEDLSHPGLPPLHVEVGTGEILLPDSSRLVDAARRQGVEADLHEGEGMPHVWQVFATTPEARESTDRVGAFLASRLG